MRLQWGLIALLALGACGDSEGSASGSDDAGPDAASGGDGGGGGAGGAGAGSGGGAGGTEDAGGAEDAGGTGARPHPLYSALDLAALPGPGGAASGAYEPPALPVTTRTVTVMGTGTQARDEIAEACQTQGTLVQVPSSAGRLGTLDLGNVEDCDIELADEVIVELLFLGHLPGPTVAPSHRVRVRGGQLGSVMVDPGSTDLVLDGVTINGGVMDPAQRPGVAIYLINDGTTGFVDRFALVRSVVRMLPTAPTPAGETDGSAYLAGNARNVFFAGNNIATAGNRNSWGFRIGGGDNFIAVDNVVRVSFHKLIRMNDGPVDYVYVRGGTWLREAGLTAGGDELNDAFAQLGDLGTDNVFIHDTTVWLLSEQPVSFGASSGAGQAGKSWEARRIAWHARSEAVVSDAHLMALSSGCVPDATCDYGLGTHSYTYDAALDLPSDPWLNLPDLAQANPDALPNTP